MCNKPFDSIICKVAFFLTAYGGLVATSGIALRLGGILMSNKEPQNTEYPFYASESGFIIGALNAAYLQWMTAGFGTLFVDLMSAADPRERFGERIATIYCINFLLLSVFGALHYCFLPFSVKVNANCLDLKAQFVEDRGESKVENDFCKDDHSWGSLFTAFAVGTSICFAGYLLLQTVYVCLRAACETQEVPDAGPTAEVPVIATEPVTTVTMTEMMAMPVPELSIQPRLP